jgi:hypothetical protein
MKVQTDISRETLEELSTISPNLEVTQTLWLWKLVPHPRRPGSEPLVHMQIAGRTIPSCTGFSDSTMRTCPKCAYISSGFITPLLSHVVNLIASAKAKMVSSCKWTLSNMSGLNIQMLELCRDYEAALIPSYWIVAVAPRKI